MAPKEAPAKVPANKNKTKDLKEKNKKGKVAGKKVVKDPFLRDITKTAIRFMARRAGVRRIDRDVYSFVYNYAENLVANLTRDGVLYAEHANKKTLQLGHIEAVLRRLGHPVAIACLNKIKTEKHLSRKNLLPVKKEPGKRRFKQGTVALREIRHEQKRSDRSVLRFLPFQRMVRRNAEKVNADMRIAKGVFLVLQLFIEHSITELLARGNLCAQHAQRISLQAADLQLVTNILEI